MYLLHSLWEEFENYTACYIIYGILLCVFKIVSLMYPLCKCDSYERNKLNPTCEINEREDTYRLVNCP